MIGDPQPDRRAGIDRQAAVARDNGGWHADGVDNADEFAAVGGGLGERDRLAVAVFEREFDAQRVALLAIYVGRRERDADDDDFAGAKATAALERGGGGRNALVNAAQRDRGGHAARGFAGTERGRQRNGAVTTVLQQAVGGDRRRFGRARADGQVDAVRKRLARLRAVAPMRRRGIGNDLRVRRRRRRQRCGGCGQHGHKSRIFSGAQHSRARRGRRNRRVRRCPPSLSVAGQLTVARKTSVRVAPAATVAIVPDTTGAA